MKILHYVKEARQERTYAICVRLYEMHRIGKSIETENSLIIPGPTSKGKWGVTAKGYRGFLCGITKIFYNGLSW